MNFPSSPSVGARVTLGPLVWTWNGSAWDLNAAYGQIAFSLVPLVNFVELSAGAAPMLTTLFSNDPDAGVVITYV